MKGTKIHTILAGKFHGTIPCGSLMHRWEDYNESLGSIITEFLDLLMNC
jgi:hypothetical protein